MRRKMLGFISGLGILISVISVVHSKLNEKPGSEFSGNQQVI